MYKSFPSHCYEPITLSSQHFLILERFTLVLYHKSSILSSVNEARRELFCKKTKSLRTHSSYSRCFVLTYQEGQFSKVIFGLLVCLPCKIFHHQWGWRNENNTWKPQWMPIPEAARACSELIKCGCKSRRGRGSHCGCVKAGLCCTNLCDCT